jgi:AraC-like DNA-binding protein
MQIQPVFQLECNQYQKWELEGWERCWFYVVVPAVPLLYLPSCHGEIIWSRKPDWLQDFQGENQVQFLKETGTPLLGIHLDGDYRYYYDEEELRHWFASWQEVEPGKWRLEGSTPRIPRTLQREKNPPLLRYAISEMVKSRGTAVVEELAEEYGYTVRQLERQFHEIYGCTPKQMNQHLRMSAAVELICGNPQESLRDIAEQLGFADASHFQREFKQYVGMTPGKFRTSLNIQ